MQNANARWNTSKASWAPLLEFHLLNCWMENVVLCSCMVLSPVSWKTFTKVRAPRMNEQRGKNTASLTAPSWDRERGWSGHGCSAYLISFVKRGKGLLFIWRSKEARPHTKLIERTDSKTLYKAKQVVAFGLWQSPKSSNNITAQKH